MFIKAIHIKNFRSFVELGKLTQPFCFEKNVSILVGRNDSGKSTLLKAMNLFFNNRLTESSNWHFDEIFSLYAKTRTGKAKQVEITLFLELPGRFKIARDKAVYIRWKKIWRANSKLLFKEEKKIYRGKETPFSKIISKNWQNWEEFFKKPISGKNTIKTWLRDINYRYVPAIKSSEYWSHLKAELLESINIANEKLLTDTKNGFVDSIRNALKQLPEYTSKYLDEFTLKEPTTIDLPQRIHNLFQSMDLSSNEGGGDKKIYLSQRGDGVNNMHIPSLLEYIHAHSSVGRPGSNKPDSVWGYEEPENNLEFRNTERFMDKILEISKKSSIQLLFTTHSPIVYMQSQKKEHEGRISVYLVSLQQNDLTSIIVNADESYAKLDATIGYHEQVSEKIKMLIQYQKDQVVEIKAVLEEINKCKYNHIVFTEDKNTEFIKVIANEVFKESPYKIISYNGESNAKKFVGIMDNVIIALAEANNQRISHILFHIDSRAKIDVNKLKSTTSREITVLRTPGKGVESFFIQFDHIEQLYPSWTIEDHSKLQWECVDKAAINRHHNLEQISDMDKNSIIQSANKNYFYNEKKLYNNIIKKLSRKLAVDNINLLRSSDSLIKNIHEYIN